MNKRARKNVAGSILIRAAGCTAVAFLTVGVASAQCSGGRGGAGGTGAGTLSGRMGGPMSLSMRNNPMALQMAMQQRYANQQFQLAQQRIQQQRAMQMASARSRSGMGEGRLVSSNRSNAPAFTAQSRAQQSRQARADRLRQQRAERIAARLAQQDSQRQLVSEQGSSESESEEEEAVGGDEKLDRMLERATLTSTLKSESVRFD